MTGGGGWRSPAVAAWEAAGSYRDLAGHRIFVVDLPPGSAAAAEPLLVVHGFPTSSFDFHRVAPALAADRRVVLVDLLGFGLSAKPDLAYTVDRQADVVAALTGELGLRELALLTHDMGDTVGGELLARQLEGRWPVEVTRRVLTNGSVYIGMAHLNPGQQLLLDLPDERLPEGAPVGEEGMTASLAATAGPTTPLSAEDLAAMWELVAHDGGHLLLPRLVRYIDERRRRERRFTGAIEEHPSPLTVVWGDADPIAVAPMVDRLLEARPDVTVRMLAGVGHFPMLEAPGALLDAVRPALA
ncbi:MAG: alpha/beta fold hydrolase [Acidimicrobiales bacterium]